MLDKKELHYQILRWETERNINTQKPSEIYIQPSAPLFYYTDMDTLWKIIENDVIWATQVRFSNDNAEYNAGKDILSKIAKNGSLAKGKDNNHDCYIICFCEGEDNLLSQWREYGRGGVSLGMDFSRKSMFNILSNGMKKPKYVYTEPIKVLYTDTEKEDCLEVIRNNKRIIIDRNEILNEIKPNYASDGFDEATKILRLIPYIKHIDFYEEKEARLIFNGFEGFDDMSEYINYFDFSKKEGWKRPYLRVKYGEYFDIDEMCKYIQIGASKNSTIYKKLRNSRFIQNKKIYLDTITEEGDIFIGNGCDQKEVFETVDRLVDSFRDENHQYRIWCDGHWPIRTITVGPSKNKDIILESIEHYKNNIYWLSYVEIKKSKTPYREKRY